MYSQKAGGGSGTERERDGEQVGGKHGRIERVGAKDELQKT
ncbi:hypothetical protein ALC57_08131 [Trachymyrmex cornetzi]|uniref:Uncharacterized protein n=1 Tax=Trachymyrmex cornetzi TaxID=471704 RepID=A0A195E3B6_9HYME|nr:hypothetical protein ALC57_08131 [Trachymyrmex cornetzi]